jgi:hypothetical protein
MRRGGAGPAGKRGEGSALAQEKEWGCIFFILALISIRGNFKKEIELKGREKMVFLIMPR